jgi:hypothetical protein
MKSFVTAATLSLALLGTTACSNLSTTQQRTLTGGAIGAAAGAGIGFMAGAPGIGAAVGGAAGAAIGGLTTPDDISIGHKK